MAIGRCSRSVHLAVKDDEIGKSAIAFPREAAAALPFRLTHVLTDNGSCFTPAFAKACVALGAAYRHTKPWTSQTNGTVERFNGRFSSEVLGINVCSHCALGQLLRGFNAACNARRQRMLDGKTPPSLTTTRHHEADRPGRPLQRHKGAPSLKPQRRSHNQIVIGYASLSGGIGNPLGSLMLGGLQNGLTLMNVPSFWQYVAPGLVVILAVYGDLLTREGR